MMPRLDGWVTAVELRKNPQTSHIKVVLITARAQEDDRMRGHQIGVDAYLTKPFDPGEMIRVVRELAGAPPTALDLGYRRRLGQLPAQRPRCARHPGGPAADNLGSVLSADLRHLVAAAAREAGYPGHWPDVGLRDGGAPGRYSCSLPLRLAANPAEVAATMATHLRAADWIEDAEPTGHGYLTITVTPERLTETAVRVTEAGPGCARSDALAGTAGPTARRLPDRRPQLARGQGSGRRPGHRPARGRRGRDRGGP